MEVCFCPECSGCHCEYCVYNKCKRVVAQGLERDPYKVEVAGSIPANTTEEEDGKETQERT